MRFAVLGPVTTVDDDGTALALGGSKPRSLLAALLLEPNRTVPLDTVMAVLWGEKPPPTATASLHNHVARLRRRLQDAGGTRLRTMPHGLQLRVGDDELDRDVFEGLIRRAQEARDGEDWEAAEQDAGAALALWRGAPFADVPALADHPAVMFLQEQRLQALECRFEALLHLDRLDGLAAELGALVREHPFREALHRQLMLVLGRTGRRAEALALFRSLRRTLVEELGVEPGPAVQEAHREVLRSPAASVPLSQLPSAPADFVGRDEHIGDIRKELEAPRGRTALAVISGMPGVGKTGLALHIAEQLREAFPDGQLYLNLHGATPGVAPLEPADALAALLHGLGMDTRHVQYDAAAASALLRSALAPTRTLLVLDDAASVGQVRPLLPAGAGCAVLLTSRRPLATLETTTHVRLDPLSPQDGARLLERASGRTFAASDAEPVARLVALCGQLPLALRVSAARLRSRRTLPVEKLVERLARQADRLDHLELEDLSVRRSLLAAHEALLGSADPRDGEAAATLVLVGALDLPEYGVPLMAAAMNRTEHSAEQALDRLVEVALLQEVSWGRYVPHDLVRDFAREMAARPDEQARTAEAAERSLHWYQERLAHCAAALRPDPRRLGEPAGTDYADAAEALAWGDSEAANLLHLAGSDAHGCPGPARTLALISTLFPYLHDRGRVRDLERLTRHAITLARSSADTAAEAQALGHLASAHYSAGRLHQALLLLDEAVALSEHLCDDLARMRHLGNRAALLRELGRGADARATLARCLALRPDRLTPGEEAKLLGHQGYVAELTDPRSALTYHRRSRELARRTGSAVIEQIALCNTGRTHLNLGEPALALRSFEEALQVMAAGGAHWNAERETRLGRAQALRTLGRLEQAEEACAALLQETTARGDSYGRGLTEHELGHVLSALGDEHTARRRWHSALSALEGTDAQVLADLRALTSDATVAAGP
ncbi:NB-ARC domain-containing protein [Streptomyces sp. NBC_00124]|uniref:AfsR/SARP family transcriptional regulator n=1 Tax=Streptomyces sp. NBC_00124 TaxID=2975662 RepID=UPI002251B604|nr:BTAD domain-containing putative transcriptional regulator [Streptomyces sp. NBC_00124]MCX5365800.1 NB-ARC domain-containing protein [Streptomyces sp. NBC_00124]